MPRQSDRTFLRASVGALSVLAMLSTPALAQQPTIGSVKSVTGAAFIVRAGQDLPLALGQSIVEGDTVRTGPDSRVGVTFKDGTRLALGANTELRVTSFAYAPAEGRLGFVARLARGVAAYVSGRIAELAPGTVKIETPASVIGIRGTHLLIGVSQ
ncbi:MAG TPA: FecR family protein [Vicinamibacterales bacterium]|nr:FecR family protein [Vicinamibacterales bacterium]